MINIVEVALPQTTSYKHIGMYVLCTFSIIELEEYNIG